MRDFFLQTLSFNNNDYLSYDSLFWDLASERILKIRWGQSTSIVCSLPCREQQCRRPSSSRSQSHHPVKKEIILKDSHHVSISTNLQQSFTLPHQLGAVVRQPLLKEHLDAWHCKRFKAYSYQQHLNQNQMVDLALVNITKFARYP